MPTTSRGPRIDEQYMVFAGLLRWALVEECPGFMHIVLFYNEAENGKLGIRTRHGLPEFLPENWELVT